jgi:4-amino-4-deoxy-L-arabinose transferase-like glycosyltransferase
VLFARLFGYWIGIGAALLVMVSGEFPQFGINATSDVFFLLLCALTLVLLASERPATRPRAALLGAVAGIAYVTRTNGVFLAPVCVVAILWLDRFRSERRERTRRAALFAVVFLIVISPWLYANWRHRGSPFYNANYLNIATEFYPELSEGRTNQDGTRRLEETFHSFGDVVRYSPGRMLAHYPLNLLESVGRSVDGTLVSPWVGCLALAGAALVAFERRSREALLLVIAGGLYFLVLGFIHWESRYYFFILFLYAGFAVAAAARLPELARSRGLLRHGAFDLLPVALWLVMFGTSLAYSRASFARFLASHPTEVLDACEYLRGRQVTGARILSRKPHLPYLCRQEWVFFPPAQSLSDFEQWLRRNPVDYVTFSSIELARRPGLAVLRDPKQAPSWLEPVWTNPGRALYVLYRPRLD